MSVSVSSFEFPSDDIDDGGIFHLDLSDAVANQNSHRSHSPVIRPIRRASLTSPLGVPPSLPPSDATLEPPSPTLTPATGSPPSTRHFLPISNVNTAPRPSSRLSLEDFELLRVIGRGAYGKVFQVRKRSSGKIYAMKVVKKADAIRRNVASNLAVEREVLEIIQHPFVVNMRYAFQSESKLYLVMEYVQGGELFTRLDSIPSHILDYKEAKFYSAQLVLALGHLHERGVIYRDLKPENILLDAQGNIVLTDFGFSKTGIMDEKDATSSFCGTLSYMAPEVIQGTGHGKAADWWSLGIVLYEMLLGYTPFRGDNRKKVQNSILNGTLKVPSSIPSDARSLITDLLRRPVHKRLGCGSDGIVAVRRHPFFDGIDWKKLEAKLTLPPFVPNILHPLDFSNFSSKFTDEPVVDSPVDDTWIEELKRRRAKREMMDANGDEEGEANSGEGGEDGTNVDENGDPNGQSNADVDCEDSSVLDPFEGFSYTHPNPSPLCSRPGSTLFKPIQSKIVRTADGLESTEHDFHLPAAVSVTITKKSGETEVATNVNGVSLVRYSNPNDTKPTSAPQSPKPISNGIIARGPSTSPSKSTPKKESTPQGKSLLTTLLNSKSANKGKLPEGTSAAAALVDSVSSVTQLLQSEESKGRTVANAHFPDSHGDRKDNVQGVPQGSSHPPGFDAVQSKPFRAIASLAETATNWNSSHSHSSSSLQTQKPQPKSVPVSKSDRPSDQKSTATVSSPAVPIPPTGPKTWASLMAHGTNAQQKPSHAAPTPAQSTRVPTSPPPVSPVAGNPPIVAPSMPFPTPKTPLSNLSSLSSSSSHPVSPPIPIVCVPSSVPKTKPTTWASLMKKE